MISARVGIGGIFIECNHFTSQLADRASFERSEWLVGDALLAMDTGVLGGMLSVLRAGSCEPVPLFYASACPNGAVQAEVYDELKNELLKQLADAGVYVFAYIFNPAPIVGATGSIGSPVAIR